MSPGQRPAEVDPAALLGDPVGDVGADRASLVPSAPLLAPQAPNRVLHNPIDTAIRCCGAAKATLIQGPTTAVISIADKAPGLPDDQFETDFERLMRLVSSSAAVPFFILKSGHPP